MKNLLFFILSFIPVLAFSQKIAINEIDDFTGDKVIETKWETLNKGRGASGRNQLYFKLRKEDDEYNLILKWVTVESLKVEEHEDMLLLLKNRDIESVSIAKDASTQKGGGSIGIQMKDVEGIHLNFYGDFDFLEDENNSVSKLRINTTQGHIDIELKENYARKLNKAYKLIEKEANK